MAFPTTPEDTLNYFLFKVMSEEDATRFLTFEEALIACEKQEPQWQALSALSAHLHFLANYGTSSQFGDYVEKHAAGFDDFLRVREALVGSSESFRVNEDELRAYHYYLLRFFTAIWQVVDKVEKHELPHEPWWFLVGLAFAQHGALFRSVGISKEEPSDSDTYKATISKDIDPERYPFVGYAKLMAANTLIPMLLKQSDYESAVEAMTKVAECLPTEEVFLKLEELVDKWLNLCIPLQQPATTQQPGAIDEWQLVGLVDRVYTIAETAGDMAKESVDRCFEAKSLAIAPRHSEDFWAWKYGYIVGRLAAVRPVLQTREWPFQHFLLEVGRGDWDNGYVVASLLFGCDPAANYFPMWLPGDGHQYLTEVTPTNGLYWAMRMGYVDGVQENAVTVMPQTSPIQKIEKIENIVTSTALRQIRDDEEIKRLLQDISGRLPPSPEETRNFLENTLSPDIFGRLPLEVADYLIEAEIELQSTTKRAHSRVDFAKAVEAAFDLCFKTPFFVYCRENRQLTRDYECYSLARWGDRLVSWFGNPAISGLDKIAAPNVYQFVRKQFGQLKSEQLTQLGQSLKRVQELRGGSAHHQPQFLLRREEQQLQELREMVLGLNDRPSIIKQMVELFGGKKDMA